MRKILLALLLCSALLAGLALSSCEEDKADCPNGPYRFDDNVDRCRDADGQFAKDECC